MKKNSDAIDKLSNEVKEIRGENNAEKTRNIVEELIEERLRITPAEGLAESLQRDRSDNKENAYYRARRALRLWPIKGRSESELCESVGRFIEDTLKVETVSPEDIAAYGE
jgi:hypothetical protein